MKSLLEVSECSALINTLTLDARFRLQDPSAAERLFLEGHIPGAQYVDLGTELSGKKTGQNGRHPLPKKEDLRALFSHLGINAQTTVVAYDDTDHAGAARLWMLLRWLGHENVRVLNGGFRAWKEAGNPEEKGPARPLAAQDFPIRPSLVSVIKIEALVGASLVDVRAPERYRGEMEPVDPRAGHIPGAKNLPYPTLLGADGKFLSGGELREKIVATSTSPTFYCGSGVTACVALLASHEAGIPAHIYSGSWSEWCSRPELPAEKGAL